MTSRRARARVVLVLVVLGLVAVAVPLWEPVWELLAWEKIYLESVFLGEPTRGFNTRNRWSDRFIRRDMWYVESAYCYRKIWHDPDGKRWGQTQWSSSGEVVMQSNSPSPAGIDAANARPPGSGESPTKPPHKCPRG